MSQIARWSRFTKRQKTGTLIRMAQVFISYRHVSPDQDLAQAIHNHFRANGVDCFLDRDLRLGENWEDEILCHLQSARYFIVLLSEESVRSDMVQYEVVIAHQQRGTQILPARFTTLREPSYTMGAYLRKIQYTKWDPCADGQAGICAQLLDAVEGRGPLPHVETQPETATINSANLGDESAPLPSADPRLVMESGTIRLDSPFYVRRRADSTLEEELALPGRTVVIRGARQTGKSSLLARAHAGISRRAEQSWFLDFQTLTADDLKDLSSLHLRLARRLQRDLDTALKVKDLWDEDDDPKTNLDDFIEKAVLRPAGDRPVYFCLDEIDRVFPRPYRDDFFAGVRAWHNRRASSPAWSRLTLLLTHSTDPSLWISRLDQSPFNVADCKVSLGDFTTPEIDWLNGQYGTPLRDASQRDQLRRIVGGQPYLIRQSLYTLKREGLPIIELSESLFADHLRHLLVAIQREPSMTRAMRRVLAGLGCEEGLAFEWLRALGAVSGDTPRTARVHCELYGRYLREHLE